MSLSIDREVLHTMQTPFYYYDMSLLKRTIDEMLCAASGHPWKIHYAVKANGERRILETISAAGFGADCVSGGEIKAAVEAGFAPGNIFYAGVGKSDDEIRYALECGIGCFNIESLEELDVVAQIAADMGRVAPVALRINPDIDAHTHEYITTGLEENKFGIDRRMLDKAVDAVLACHAVRLRGLHFHIGSQITVHEPFKLLCERINSMTERLETKRLHLDFINVGGGIGIDYDNPDSNPVADFKSFFEVFNKNLRLRDGQEIHCEPGRSVVAQCGSLIARVLYVKEGIQRRFAILDAGMTDLIRPALYGARHKIDKLTPHSGDEEMVYDIVGPVCESTDVFAKDEKLPRLRRNDLVAFRSAGAYGQSMSSCYNMRRLPRAVYSDDVVRLQETR